MTIKNLVSGGSPKAEHGAEGSKMATIILWASNAKL